MSSIQRRFNDYENAYLNNIDFSTYNHSQSHSYLTLSSKIIENTMENTINNTLTVESNNDILNKEEEEMTEYNTSDNLNYVYYGMSNINQIHSPEDSEYENHQEIDYPDEENF